MEHSDDEPYFWLTVSTESDWDSVLTLDRLAVDLIAENLPVAKLFCGEAKTYCDYSLLENIKFKKSRHSRYFLENDYVTVRIRIEIGPEHCMLPRDVMSNETFERTKTFFRNPAFSDATLVIIFEICCRCLRHSFLRA